MILYHGGPVPVSKTALLPSRNHKDFGPGFYCTSIRAQAERWALRSSTATVSTFLYTPDPSLNVLDFSSMTDEWLDFIANCRRGIPHSYDIVSGSMANDQVWNYVADFIQGTISREAFWALAKFKYPTHQIAFCTPTALRTLSFQASDKGTP